MSRRKTELMRLDSELVSQLRWLAEFDRAQAAKDDRKPRTAAQILRDLAGRSIGTAYAKIETWKRSVEKALAAPAKAGGE